MKCPKDGARLMCFETRPNPDGRTTVRRLKCPTCGDRYHTEETFVGVAKKGRPIYGVRPHVHELRKQMTQLINKFEADSGIVDMTDDNDQSKN